MATSHFREASTQEVLPNIKGGLTFMLPTCAL